MADDGEWNYGQRIRLARELKGVSQAELARRLGLWQDKVSRMETGGRHVKVAELVAIADALGVPVLVFLPPMHRHVTLTQIELAAQMDRVMLGQSA